MTVAQQVETWNTAWDYESTWSSIKKLWRMPRELVTAGPVSREDWFVIRNYKFWLQIVQSGHPQVAYHQDTVIRQQDITPVPARLLLKTDLKTLLSTFSSAPFYSRTYSVDAVDVEPIPVTRPAIPVYWLALVSEFYRRKSINGNSRIFYRILYDTLPYFDVHSYLEYLRGPNVPATVEMAAGEFSRKIRPLMPGAKHGEI